MQGTKVAQVCLVFVVALSCLRLFSGTRSLEYHNVVQDEPFVDTSKISTVLLGKEYNAQACHLEPAWGTSQSGSCVGATPTLPNTTARHLQCVGDKPSPVDRSHPGVTIALLYYAKPALLVRQLEEFTRYPVEIQRGLTLLIVDDASPSGLRVSDFLPRNYTAHFRIRLARIVTEKNWNIGGARNLAFYLVDTSVALLLDLDILVPLPAMKAALSWPQRNASHQLAHRFNRIRPDGSTGKHPAVSILDTGAYWEIGGCDEDFCGSYGFTDVHFWFRWKADKSRLLIDHLDTYLVELDMAPCNQTYLTETQVQSCKAVRSKMTKPGRELKRNHARYKNKTKSGCWSNKYLRFRWMLDR